MTDSDNVCYRNENKGLSDFDSAINSPKLQAPCAGETPDSSAGLPICEWCGESFDPSSWEPYQRISRSGRFCGTSCARAYAASAGWKIRSHRRTCSSVSPLSKAERNQTRARTRHLIRMGRLAAPKFCTQCGAAGPLETHHVDYADPRLVLWLCPDCHRVENNRQRDAHKRSQGSSVSHDGQSPTAVGQKQDEA
jgi:hypothetical protein